MRRGVASGTSNITHQAHGTFVVRTVFIVRLRGRVADISRLAQCSSQHEPYSAWALYWRRHIPNIAHA